MKPQNVTFPNQGLVHSNSSDINQNELPCVILSSIHLFVNPDLYTTTEYRDMYQSIFGYDHSPRQLNFIPRSISHSHKIHVKLPKSSFIYNRDICILVARMHSKEDIESIDSMLAYGSICIDKDFVMYVLANELNNYLPTSQKIKFNVFSDHFTLCKYRSILRHFYFGRYNKLKFIRRVNFECFCDQSHVEPTSLLEGGSTWEGIKHSFLALYNFSTSSENKVDIMRKKVEDWMLELSDLFVNLNIKKLFFTLLKLIKDYINITENLEYMVSLVLKAYNYIIRNLSTQPSQDVNTLEPTSLVDAIDLDTMITNGPAISAVFSAIITIFANVICVRTVMDNKMNENLTTKLAKSLHLTNMGSTALQSIIKNIINFSKLVYSSTFDLLLGEKSSALYKLVHLTSVVENENCKKNELFQYIEFLEHPANLQAIHANQAYKSQLEFCHKIFEEIQILLTTEDHKDITSQVRDYVKARISALNAIRGHIYKRPTVDPIRFTPYWLNILGEPGLGKSVAVPLISNYVKEILRSIPEDFETTADDRWLFPVNFSDEFLTHYNGHYIVTCDDFLQDTPGTLTQSSALKVITWISCIPSFTVQAALSDKGTPFTSKIFISTSNDKAMNRTNEINSALALIRRMNLCVELFEDENRKVADPLIGVPGKMVSIRRLDKFDRTKTEYVYKDTQEFLNEFISDYIKWYKHQNNVIKSRQTDKDKVREMAELIMNKCGIIDYKKEAIKIQAQVEETSALWCRCGFSPNVKVRHHNDLKLDYKLWDCDCEQHQMKNSLYVSYLEACSGITTYTDIRNFENYGPDPYTLQFKDETNKLYSKIKLMTENIWKNNTARYIMYALVTIGMVYTGYKLLGSNGVALTAGALTGATACEASAAQYSQKVVRARKYKARISKSNKPIKLESTDTELEQILSQTISKQSYDLTYNNIIKNGGICQIYLKDKLNRTHVNTAVRIAGRAILSNHHFFRYLEEGDQFLVKYFTQATGYQQVQQLFRKENLYQIENTDVVVYYCSKSLPESKDITKHFQQEDSLLITNQDALIVTRHPANSTPVVMMNVTASPNVHSVSYQVEDDDYAILDSYVTNCPVEKGMSGSILISTDTRSAQKILGIQTCRDTQTLHGYFQPITCQQLQDALKSLNVKSFEFRGGELEMTKVIIDSKIPPNISEDGALAYLGSIPRNMCIKGQLNTKLEPSLIHDEDIVTQQPSVLSDYDERMRDDLKGKSVIFRAVEGFNSAKGVIDQNLLNRAVNELKEEYNVTLDCKNIARRILTDNEMINGIPAVINRVEMKSSPGYPLVLQRKDTCRGGKYEWFEEITPLPGYGKTYVMKKELADGLKQHEQQLLQGIKPPVIAYACLKDETRSLAKIESGSTRAFVCLPLIYNLLIRKYFGAFIACQHQQAGKITSSVGINPATQWKQLFNKLSEKSDLWEDFDYKNWDQHLPPDFVLSVSTIVNRWYGDADDSPVGLLRYMLIYDLVFTYIIVKDRLFQKSTGQCSGCAITAELNCLVHDILMYYVWLKICKQNDMQTTLFQYRDNVACIMYGDDIVMAVRHSYKNIFNGNTIKPHMDELGMLITPGDKISETFAPKYAKDILFLKRSFQKDGDYVKAPLRSDIVENIPQWIHKSDDPVEATRVNCETALRESYMHGKKYFLEVLSNLNERIKIVNRNTTKFQIPPIIMDYDSLNELYQNSEFICAGLNGPQNMSEELW